MNERYIKPFTYSPSLSLTLSLALIPSATDKVKFTGDCKVCRKLFSNENALKNHEHSKKHLENVKKASTKNTLEVNKSNKSKMEIDDEEEEEEGYTLVEKITEIGLSNVNYHSSHTMHLPPPPPSMTSITSSTPHIKEERDGMDVEISLEEAKKVLASERQLLNTECKKKYFYKSNFSIIDTNLSFIILSLSLSLFRYVLYEKE